MWFLCEKKTTRIDGSKRSETKAIWESDGSYAENMSYVQGFWAV